MGKSKQTTTTKTNMSINKLTLAALAAAYANGVQISSQSKDVFSDIGNWFENDFVDFWTDDFAGAFEDLGDWFAGDFADWWTEDFADFLTEDFAGAFEDAGDWLAGDFADWWTNDFVDFWQEDFVNFWEEDFVDFWEYTVPEVILGAPSKEEQEEMEEKKKEYEEKKKEIEEMKAKIAEMCAQGHPVGALTKNGFTTTNNFNWRYERNQDERALLYSILGKRDAAPITPESCDKVDCMHKCYGVDQMGACDKCIHYYLEEEGVRHTICDMCVV